MIGLGANTQRGVGQMDFLLYLFRPLLTVDEARYLLAEPAAQTVRDRLDDGTLRGIDISVGGEKAERRELRIYRYSVEWLFTPATKGRRLALMEPEAILPHGRDCFRRDEVAALLNCTPKHVGNLNFGCPSISLAAVGASVDRTSRVTRPALLDFLNAREVRT